MSEELCTGQLKDVPIIYLMYDFHIYIYIIIQFDVCKLVVESEVLYLRFCILLCIDPHQSCSAEQVVVSNSLFSNHEQLVLNS